MNKKKKEKYVRIWAYYIFLFAIVFFLTILLVTLEQNIDRDIQAGVFWINFYDVFKNIIFAVVLPGLVVILLYLKVVKPKRG